MMIFFFLGKFFVFFLNNFDGEIGAVEAERWAPCLVDPKSFIIIPGPGDIICMQIELQRSLLD